MKLGVPQTFMFAPLDLFEGTGIPGVVLNVLYLKHMLDHGQYTLADEPLPSPTPARTTTTVSAPPSPTPARATPTPTSTPNTARTASPPSSLTPPASPLSASTSARLSNVHNTSKHALVGGSGSPGSSPGAAAAAAEVTTFDQDIKIKEELKYSAELEDAVKEWMCGVLKNDALFAGNITFFGALQSGTILCQLMETLKPGSVPKAGRKSGAFASMQNVLAFLKACEWIGLPKSMLFTPGDLVDGRNANRVLDTLNHLAQHAVSRGLTAVPIRDTSQARTLFSQTLSEVSHPGSELLAADNPSLREPCAPEHQKLLDWANRQLAKAAAAAAVGGGGGGGAAGAEEEEDLVLHNFGADVRTGVKLLKLAEALMQEQCWGVWYDPPLKLSECMQNACLLFSWLEQRTLDQILCCQPQDIVRGNVPRVVALVEFMRDKLDLRSIL